MKGILCTLMQQKERSSLTTVIKETMGQQPSSKEELRILRMMHLFWAGNFEIKESVHWIHWKEAWSMEQVNNNYLYRRR
jgi:DNA polymerase III delta prime subunit